MGINWNDRVKNEEVLHRKNEERNILHTVEERKVSLVTHCIGNDF